MKTFKSMLFIVLKSVVIKMEFKTQSMKLPVANFDKFTLDWKREEKRHGNLLPNSVRAIFCGPSNCGKTNALLTLLTHPNGLRFENIYIYSKSLNQPKYRFLEKVLQSVNDIKYFPFNEHGEVVQPNEAQPNSIIVFDDVACDKQDNIRAFFSMGRHRLIDCFYLCQTYARIPKHLIRDNVNFLVLFKQDEMNLKHIYDDHVNTDMSFSKFKELCSACWDNKYGFLVIDKDNEINQGRYRKCFDCFINLRN